MKYVILTVFGICGIIIEGAVFNLLWAWFVSPVFHVAQPGMAYCIGLALVACLMTHQYIPGSGDTENDEWGSASVGIVRPLLCLLIGAIVRLFI